MFKKYNFLNCVKYWAILRKIDILSINALLRSTSTFFKNNTRAKQNHLALLKRSVAEENVSNKSKHPSPFLYKTIGSNDSFTLIENNFRFSR